MSLEEIYSQIPPEIFRLDHKLKEAGFESFLVGGCVRDILLNLKPKDYDIATNATPDQIAIVFPQSVTTYAKFGTVLVLAQDEEYAQRFRFLGAPAEKIKVVGSLKYDTAEIADTVAGADELAGQSCAHP